MNRFSNAGTIKASKPYPQKPVKQGTLTHDLLQECSQFVGEHIDPSVDPDGCGRIGMGMDALDSISEVADFPMQNIGGWPAGAGYGRDYPVSGRA